MIRRLKKDVMSELPAKRRQQVLLGIDKKHSKMIGKIFKEFKDVKKKMFLAKSKDSFRENRSDKHRLILELYKGTGVAKVLAVNEYLKDLIEGGDFKFLVFGHHKDMLDGISYFLRVLFLFVPFTYDRVNV